jgi:hypothetical protein
MTGGPFPIKDGSLRLVEVAARWFADQRGIRAPALALQQRFGLAVSEAQQANAVARAIREGRA